MTYLNLIVKLRITGAILLLSLYGFMAYARIVLPVLHIQSLFFRNENFCNVLLPSVSAVQLADTIFTLSKPND
jgi:hypothetical protein